MRVFISADIEGVTGVTSWDECDKSHRDYPEFRAQMNAEVRAACHGAFSAGAELVRIKDAHASGRNLEHGKLPPRTELVRGWAGHPLCMVQEVDDSFAAAMFVGYHGAASDGGNPLAHTLSGGKVFRMTLNGVVCSEFLLHAHGCARFGVPVVLVTGDEALCRHVAETNPAIEGVAVKRGVGDSTVSIHPAEALNRIEDAAQRAIARRQDCALDVPDRYELVIEYKRAQLAYRASHYPGAEAISDSAVRFVHSDFGEVQRMIMFCV